MAGSGARRVVLLGFLFAAPVEAYELKEFPLPAGSYPNFIAAGPDGNMWFAEWGTDNIGIITPAGAIAHYAQGGCKPIGLALGADGYVWFNCTVPTGVNTSIEKTRDVSTYAFFSGLPAATGPVIATPDGRICYAAAGNQAQFISLAGAAVGTPHIYPAPVTGLAPGGDGRVWLTQASVGGVCYVDSQNAACGASLSSAPFGIAWSQVFGAAVVADQNAGDVFYECSAVDANGFVCGSNPFPLGMGALPTNVATAPDGSVWITDEGANEVDHLFLNSFGGQVVTHYSVPTPNATPYGIAVSADGTVWFTENTGQKIGRLRVRPGGDVNGDGSVTVADVFYLINFLFAGGAAPAP